MSGEQGSPGAGGADDAARDKVIAALARRVRVLEDEKAVRDTLTRYGFAVDSGDVEATVGLFSDDCLVDIDAAVFMRGAEVRQIVESPAHRRILPGCSHLMGPFAVTLEGDRAVATGYAMVYVKEEGSTRIWRQACGRWELEKRAGRWQITKRVSRSVGSAAAQELLRSGL